MLKLILAGLCFLVVLSVFTDAYKACKKIETRVPLDETWVKAILYSSA
jgi:hypothetical protein